MGVIFKILLGFEGSLSDRGASDGGSLNKLHEISTKQNLFKRAM